MNAKDNYAKNIVDKRRESLKIYNGTIRLAL